MSRSPGRIVIAAACLALLTGCETSTKLGDFFHSKSAEQTTPGLTDQDAATEPATTGSVGTLPTGPLGTLPPPPPDAAGGTGLLGNDPNDDLSLGKKQYRAGNFGLAERYFRRAVELHPRDGEAWLDLAAAYDRLRRFDLADRAYRSAIAIIGPTAEILNNRGYSYMLRGDYAHARETLLAAAAKDPKNPYIKNNLDLLDKSFRNGKAVQ
jgi:tetratricopeptide (TPR) repeat protein